jgi:hypothetical protein
VQYEYGRGVPKDLGKPAELYQKAADRGFAAAQNNLGELYYHGRGVTKDLGKAADLYQKAADQGNPDAQTNLAWLHVHGEGVPKDFGKAAELFQKGANELKRKAEAAKPTPSQTEQEHAPAFPPGVGGVRINTSPPGATAALGGLGAKKTPVTFNANSGKYSLFIELDGYEPVAHEVEAREGELVDLGTITLQRGRSGVELTTVPQGAKVFQGDTLLGSTPLHLDNLPSGQTNFLFVLKGYLPREIRAQLNSREIFKTTVTLAKALQVYKGMISETVPITMKFGPLCASGIMTQSSTRGDTIVKFTGVWDGATLRAFSHEVVSKPEGILWEPESFAIRFSDDGKSAFYQCNYGTEMFVAKLSAL